MKAYEGVKIVAVIVFAVDVVVVVLLLSLFEKSSSKEGKMIFQT
jgi:hypothetical protein